jgi:hypothetical protein
MLYIKYLVPALLLLVACSDNNNNKSTQQENEHPVKEGQKVSSKTTNQIIEAGWEFAKSRLLSPSTSKLVSSKYGIEVSQSLEKYSTKTGAKLPDCITVGYFEYDAQNGFGALIRDGAYVFYRNGKPCYLETKSAIENSIASYYNMGIPENFIPALNMVITEWNGCGCE